MILFNFKYKQKNLCSNHLDKRTSLWHRKRIDFFISFLPFSSLGECWGTSQIGKKKEEECEIYHAHFHCLYRHKWKSNRSVNFSMHIFDTLTSLGKRALLEAPNMERFFSHLLCIQLTWRVLRSTTNRKQEFEISVHLFSASRVIITKRVFHTIFTLGIAFGTVESNMA